MFRILALMPKAVISAGYGPRYPTATYREDHFVPHLQAREYFHGGHGAAPQLHVDARGFRAICRNLEEADGGVLLAMHWPPHIKHVLEVFQLDGAIYAEVRARPGWQRLIEHRVHGDRAVHDGGIDARDMSDYHSVSR